MENDLVKQLLDQNQLLISQMAEMMKAQTKPVNKHDLNMDILQNFNPYSFEKFIELLRENQTNKLIQIQHIQFYEYGYVKGLTELILRLLQNSQTRPLHTFNKKNKQFVIFQDDKWNKITYQEFKKIVKRFEFFITKAIVGIFIHNKKKIIAEKGIDWLDNTQYILMSDTNEVLDEICNKLIDALIPF